jgi:hypothetical protein
MLDGATGSVLISEFVASNDGTVRDLDDDASDWIELSNSGDAAVNLDGWALTDSASNLRKWRLPAVSLGPGESLVVFASSKDRAVAGQELHTNFSLSASGEYLGLVRPDGSIADDYGPSYPAQVAGVSYGHPVTSTSLIAAGATAQVLVPSDGSLGASWTDPAFVTDGSWTTGPTEVGFGVPQAGFRVRTVQATTTLDSLASAIAALDTPALQASSVVTTSPTINYVGRGAAGHFDANQVFPGQLVTQDIDNFALEAVGTVTIPSAGAWTFGVTSDDGFSLTLERPGYAPLTIAYPPARATLDTIQTLTIPEAGDWSIRLVYFDWMAGANVELYAAPGAFTTFQPTMRLVGDTAGGGLAVRSDAGGLGAATDPSAAMLGTSATAYVRIPFTLTDPSAIASLVLRLQYDDGFVAYLNGVEVARRNAPGDTLDWTSAASASRPQGSERVAESIGLSAYLGLLQPGSNVLTIQGLNASADDPDFLILPELLALTADATADRYFGTPTPGAANGGEAAESLLAGVSASVEHGLFDAPFALSLTTPDAGASIRYTLDGSTPSATHGLDYTGPLTISGTTSLRAVAVRAGGLATSVLTQTYLFPADIVNQASNGQAPAGWPAEWGWNQVDYGMDPDILAAFGADAVAAALRALPSISITTDMESLFRADTGIYANANLDGRDWERPASFELLEPSSGGASSGLTIDAGLRIRGAFSTMAANAKHSLRLFFRDEYGGDLEYPLFGADGASVFERMDLPTAQNYSWNIQDPERYTFLRDVFSRDTQRDLGQLATRSQYYHLYLNGQYWGLYQTQERADAFFGETYLGGDEDDYDVIKVESSARTVEATDGTLDAWNRLWAAASNGFASYAD